MNTKLLLSAVAAAALSMAGGMAMADEASAPMTPVIVAQATYTPNLSTANLLLERSTEAGTSRAYVKPGNILTRVQVKSAYAAAQANGTLIVSDADSYWKVPAAPSTLTRDQVKSAFNAAEANSALPQNDDSEYVDANAAKSVGHMDRAHS